MLVVLSPAKNLDYETALPTAKHTKANLLSDAQELAEQMKAMSPQDISSLMGISDKLGVLNYDRYQAWALPFEKSTARQALFAFKGDVYIGLNAYEFDTDDMTFAQEHLRILSGLYGILKPLDWMQPYRLEMGTKLANARGKNLYEFWGTKISGALNKQLKKTGDATLVNLASQEYFKSVDLSTLNATVITPTFKDWKNGKYKIISFFAKKARGLMSAYIIKNKISDVEQIKGFDWEGYGFDPSSSSESEWVFTRKQP
ncbi:MAG: peroxide stress protein YaaA [Agarilytica sp.]